MTRFALIRRGLFLLAAVACLPSSAATAQPQGTFSSNRGQVNGIELKLGSTVLLSHTSFLSPDNVCKAIYSKEIRKFLNDLVLGFASGFSGSLPKDIRLVRQRFDLSPGCKAQVNYTGNQLSITASMPRNIFFAHVTTPGPVGQFADPSVSIDFDVTVTATVTIPSTPQQGLSLGPARLRIFKIDPQGQNLTGDVGVAVAKLADEFGKFGFADKLAQGFNVSLGEMKLEIDKFSTVLGQRGQNLKLSNDYDTARRLVVLNLGDPGVGSPRPPIGANVPAQPAQWVGRWDTRTNAGGHYEIVFRQEGEKLVGSFRDLNGNSQYDGTLTGKVTGSQLLYDYVQPKSNGKGSGMFMLNNDGKAIIGAGAAADAAKTKFSWRGTKIGGDAKMVCPAGMKGPKCDEMDVR